MRKGGWGVFADLGGEGLDMTLPRHFIFCPFKKLKRLFASLNSKNNGRTVSVI